MVNVEFEIRNLYIQCLIIFSLITITNKVGTDVILIDWFLIGILNLLRVFLF